MELEKLDVLENEITIQGPSIMKCLASADKTSKRYTTLFANELYQIVVKIYDGKNIPHDKYSFSLIHLPLLSASVSMSAAKLVNFALYEPELSVTDIQAALWTKVRHDVTDSAALLVRKRTKTPNITQRCFGTGNSRLL
jgi:hypothetical protein